jgi:hypothetical protein
MSKSFRATPSNDRYNLNERVEAIEATPSPSAEITLVSNGGLERDANGHYKAQVSANGGFRLGDNGLELMPSSISPNHLTSNHASDTGGLEMTTVNPKKRMKVKLDGPSLTTSIDGLKIGDDAITKAHLDFNESIFEAMCTSRSNWINFQPHSAPYGSGEIQLANNWIGLSSPKYYEPQLMAERFDWIDGVPIQYWWRMSLRGQIKKTTDGGTWQVGETIAVIQSAHLIPQKTRSYRVACYDNDNTPLRRNGIQIDVCGLTDYDRIGFIRLQEFGDGNSIQGSSNLDLCMIAWDTL